MIDKYQIIITNNPKVKEFYDNFSASKKINIDLLFCENRDEVFIQVRNYIHKNWKLINHAMAGNIPLHKHPYRSIAIKKVETVDTDSVLLWENAMDRVKRGSLPFYNFDVLLDFQELDYILFTDNLSI